MSPEDALKGRAVVGAAGPDHAALDGAVLSVDASTGFGVGVEESAANADALVKLAKAAHDAGRQARGYAAPGVEDCGGGCQINVSFLAYIYY